MSITISMLKRDWDGKPTNQRVEHTAAAGHSVHAFFVRGGRSHAEVKGEKGRRVARLVRVMKEQVASPEPEVE